MSNATIRRSRALAAACLGIGLLAGCAFQPIGTFDRAQFMAQAGDGRYDLNFLPETADLAPGEIERLVGFLQTQALSGDDQVLMTFVSSGSIDLDRSRVVEASRIVRESGSPARLHVVNTREHDRADLRSEVVLVEALRQGQLLVACPRRHLDGFEQEFGSRLPALGCANAANLAHMAARPSDLVAPRTLGRSEAVTSGAPVQRHWDGEVIAPPPLATDRRR